ncbi:MAG TPA: hypothetical protein VGE01_01710 [Fimbriimonas sp.]
MNRLAKITTLGIAALTLGAATASAQVTKAGQGYQFRLKFTKGQTIKYKVSSVVPMPGQPQPFSMSMPVAQTIAAVTGNVATVNVQAGPMLLNGKPATTEPMKSTVKVSSLGKPVGQASSAGTFTTYPAAPVKVGGTWTSTVPLGGMGGPGAGGTATAVYKLLGFKTVNGKQAAEVSIAINSKGPQPATGQGRGLISMADGMPIKMDIKLNMSNPQSTGQKMTANISILRA